ncbi:MAG: hypothetical protein NWE86_04490 [Candidatus Bathyarchaeota archaeon]|nr:hypothetical protein [Candidatus Bathyarchaeota archaeon]
MEKIKKFGIEELIGSLIIIVIGIVLTIFIGWTFSAFLTAIIAFFFFRFIGTLGQKESESFKSLCKFCGEELSWIPQHSRYYCNNCQKYPPTCPDCGKDLFWMPQYNRLYCNTCQKYLEEQVKKKAGVEKPKKRSASKRKKQTGKRKNTEKK